MDVKKVMEMLTQIIGLVEYCLNPGSFSLTSQPIKDYVASSGSFGPYLPVEFIKSVDQVICAKADTHIAGLCADEAFAKFVAVVRHNSATTDWNSNEEVALLIQSLRPRVAEFVMEFQLYRSIVLPNGPESTLLGHPASVWCASAQCCKLVCMLHGGSTYRHMQSAIMEEATTKDFFSNQFEQTEGAQMYEKFLKYLRISVSDVFNAGFKKTVDEWSASIALLETRMALPCIDAPIELSTFMNRCESDFTLDEVPVMCAALKHKTIKKFIASFVEAWDVKRQVDLISTECSDDLKAEVAALSERWLPFQSLFDVLSVVQSLGKAKGDWVRQACGSTRQQFVDSVLGVIEKRQPNPGVLPGTIKALCALYVANEAV